MTLGQIDNRLQRLMGELEGSAGAGDPFTRLELIQEATDSFAQETDAFWLSWKTPAVDGQAGYCLPALYKLRAVSYQDADGNFHPLLPKSIPEMDRMYRNVSWRNSASVSVPRNAVITGMDSATLWPPPSVASPNTCYVEFEGYAIPSKAFKSDGTTALFALPADECPLNAVCHPGIAYKALTLRIMQFPTPENMARLPMAEREATRYLGLLAGFAMNYAPPYRWDKRYRWSGSI